MRSEGHVEDRYEYRVVEPPEDSEDELDRTGQDGWCLAATVERAAGERFVLRRDDPRPETPSGTRTSERERRYPVAASGREADDGVGPVRSPGSTVAREVAAGRTGGFVGLLPLLDHLDDDPRVGLDLEDESLGWLQLVLLGLHRLVGNGDA